MPSANEIRDVKFTVAKNGYLRNEVDDLLDAVEADYLKYETETAKLRAAVASLTKELEEAKSSENSIQTVLISAQKLADEIVEKARLEAAEIIAESKNKTDLAEQKAKEAIIEIERQAIENRKIAEAEIEKMRADALATTEAMITSAKDSVARQQIQFETIKSEVSQFKEQIKAVYKEHIELLAKIPDEVTGNPIEASDAMVKIIAEARAAKEAEEAEAEKRESEEPAAPEEIFTVVPEETEEQSAETQAEETEEEILPALEETDIEEVEESEGFTINLPEFPEETDEEEDEEEDEDDNSKGFSASKFFRRRG